MEERITPQLSDLCSQPRRTSAVGFWKDMDI